MNLKAVREQDNVLNHYEKLMMMDGKDVREQDVLNHYEKQVIHYAKGKFERGDLLEDMKVLVSEQCAIETRRVAIRDVYEFILNVYFALHEAGYLQRDIQSFLLGGLFESTDDRIDCKGLLEKMVREMSVIRVAGLNLGEADGSLLPRKR